ncbi:uncharacterized protein SETTUDRAFT_158631 [Exserohilum turcica Et28A]|uniref:Uncharacterized protein n=1 Tax=Exserohilum turcicum (strain 28A) TaxID=671987 RepID=R0KEA2_EXST2|nr:uncharacterized protein SETTUDRAFT_158631 [Exserohilum turcica Et28A]EOA91173.1 hypothetical protein SETTUDRAFT_158631 [Exserohilum turcica Et28A]
MPRNGDGSSDNGPIEGHEILHGMTGDDSLQHTKHAAPMPAAEHGDALPGMSGGGTAATVPVSINGTQQSDVVEASEESSSTSISKKRTEPHHASPERSQLDQKFTKLDADEVDIAAAQTESQERGARAQRRSDALGETKSEKQQKMGGTEEASKFGGHADVEALHGAATLEGDKSSEGAGKTKKQGNGAVEVHDADMLQRKKAEKFGGVNLENEGQTTANASKPTGENGGAHAGEHGETHVNGKEQQIGTKTAGRKDSLPVDGKESGHAMDGKGSGNGAVEVHEADKLQRSKAAKFGGVNLGDE